MKSPLDRDGYKGVACGRACREGRLSMSRGGELLRQVVVSTLYSDFARSAGLDSSSGSGTSVRSTLPMMYLRTSLRVMTPMRRPLFPPRFSSSCSEGEQLNHFPFRVGTYLPFDNNQSVYSSFLHQLEQRPQGVTGRANDYTWKVR